MFDIDGKNEEEVEKDIKEHVGIAYFSLGICGCIFLAACGWLFHKAFIDFSLFFLFVTLFFLVMGFLCIGLLISFLYQRKKFNKKQKGGGKFI